MLPTSKNSLNLHRLDPSCLSPILLCIDGVESTRDCSLVCKELFQKMQQNEIWYPLCIRDGVALRTIDGSYKKRYQYEYNQESGRFTYRSLKNLPPLKNFRMVSNEARTQNDKHWNKLKLFTQNGKDWNKIALIEISKKDNFCMTNNKLAILGFKKKENEEESGEITIRDLKTNEQSQFQAPLQRRADLAFYNVTLQDDYFFCRDTTKTNIYDIAEKKFLWTLEKSCTFKKFAFYEKKIITPNKDSTGIDIYDIPTGSLLKSLPLPQDRIISKSITVFQNKIFVVARMAKQNNRHICVWDDETKTFQDHLITQNPKHEISCTTTSKDEFFIGTTEGRICVWDDKTKIFKNHPITQDPVLDATRIFLLTISDRLLIIYHAKKSLDAKLSFWNIDTLTHLNTLSSAHSDSPHYILSNKTLFFHQYGLNKFLNMDKDVTGPSNFKIFHPKHCNIWKVPPCYASDTNFFRVEGKHGDRTISNYDFLANYNEILIDIKQSLLPNTNNFSMNDFLSISETKKNKIYSELYEVMKPFKNDYSNCAEDAFHNKNGCSATDAERALAMESYLAKKQFAKLSQEDKKRVYQQLYRVIGHFENDYFGCAKDAFHNRNGQSSTLQQRLLAIRSLNTFAIDRFLSLPTTIKNQIYGELYEVMKPLKNDYPNCAEDAFRDRNGQGATDAERALAIESYLAKGQFRSLSQEERNQVYQELYQVIGHFENDYFGCAEDAFHNRNGQSSTLAQRLQAMKNYFANRS
jgi:hypothetical protein